MEIVVILLIGTVLVLAGVAGLQFSYLFYADRLNRSRKKHIRDLERRCIRLKDKLETAEAKVAERDALIGRYFIDGAADEEAWAEVIDV